MSYPNAERANVPTTTPADDEDALIKDSENTLAEIHNWINDEPMDTSDQRRGVEHGYFEEPQENEPEQIPENIDERNAETAVNDLDEHPPPEDPMASQEGIAPEGLDTITSLLDEYLMQFPDEERRTEFLKFIEGYLKTRNPQQ